MNSTKLYCENRGETPHWHDHTSICEVCENMEATEPDEHIIRLMKSMDFAGHICNDCVKEYEAIYDAAPDPLNTTYFKYKNEYYKCYYVGSEVVVEADK